MGRKKKKQEARMETEGNSPDFSKVLHLEENKLVFESKLKVKLDQNLMKKTSCP